MNKTFSFSRSNQIHGHSPSPGQQNRLDESVVLVTPSSSGHVDIPSVPVLSEILNWRGKLTQVQEVTTKHEAKRSRQEALIQAAGEKRETVKSRIAEKEESIRKLNEKLQLTYDEIENGGKSVKEDINTMKLKIKENEQSSLKYKDLTVEQMEYSSLVGALVSKGLKLDYREDPGNCLCPERKVCASSRDADIGCDFWHCPKTEPEPS